MKIKLTFAYNGAKFCGSQSQPNGTGVEDALHRALGKIGIFTHLASSGRTDKGVSALAQTATLEVGEHWAGRLGVLVAETNRHLRGELAHALIVRGAEAVGAEFSARFSARARLYRYVLCHEPPSVFGSDFALFCARVDLAALNRALAAFVGRHNFAGFCKKGGWEKSYEREIYRACAYSARILGAECTVVVFCGNAFLRAQVRLMLANALVAAGRGAGGGGFGGGVDCGVGGGSFGGGVGDVGEEFGANLAEKTAPARSPMAQLCEDFRPLTRIPAPPNGLYLCRVFY